MITPSYRTRILPGRIDAVVQQWKDKYGEIHTRCIPTGTTVSGDDPQNIVAEWLIYLKPGYERALTIDHPIFYAWYHNL